MSINIKILGTGCQKCRQLEALTEKIAQELELDYNLEKVSDISSIVSYGILNPPALVINEQIKASGRIPSSDELKQILINMVKADEKYN